MAKKNRRKGPKPPVGPRPPTQPDLRVVIQDLRNRLDAAISDATTWHGIAESYAKQVAVLEEELAAYQENDDDAEDQENDDDAEDQPEDE